MRLLLLPLLFLASAALAQPQVRITDPKALDTAPDVRRMKAAAAAMAAEGLTREQQELVRRYGDRDDRPEGIRNDSARAANAPYIQNYACFRVCTFLRDGLPTAVLMVPARENLHMPEEMRPRTDFYLVVPERELASANTGRPRPEITGGPSWKGRPKARILKPEDLYSTYDLAHDSTALAALRQSGMTPAEVDAVVFRGHERNWPAGISDFDRRYPHIEQFKRYKAYLGARWGGKVLVIVPEEKNKRMPAPLRPAADLYFVFAAPAVDVK